MINANELMLGNYVQDIVSGEWMIVDEIGKKTGATLINRDKFPLPDGWEMGPIELTREVLEEAGFERDGYGSGPHSFKYQKGYVVLFFDENEKAVFFCYYKDENRKKGRTIRTVHDLQNLYFTLTGEELKIILN